MELHVYKDLPPTLGDCECSNVDADIQLQGRVRYEIGVNHLSWYDNRFRSWRTYRNVRL